MDSKDLMVGGGAGIKALKSFLNLCLSVNISIIFDFTISYRMGQ